MCDGRPPEPKDDHSLVSQKGSNYFIRIDPNIFPFKSLAVTSVLGGALLECDGVLAKSCTVFRHFHLHLFEWGVMEMAVRMCPLTGRMEWLAYCHFGCLQCIWEVFGFCAVSRIGSRLEPHREIVPLFCGWCQVSNCLARSVVPNKHWCAKWKWFFVRSWLLPLLLRPWSVQCGTKFSSHECLCWWQTILYRPIWCCSIREEESLQDLVCCSPLALRSARLNVSTNRSACPLDWGW